MRVCINAEMALFGLTKHDKVNNKDGIQLANLLTLIAKLCISKYKYGTPYNMIMMFDREFDIRSKQVPEIFRGAP